MDFNEIFRSNFLHFVIEDTVKACKDSRILVRKNLGNVRILS